MRNSRNLVVIDKAVVVGKFVVVAKLPETGIEVPSSGLSGLIHSGTKCDHGVYIPANSYHPDKAEFCTLCNPLNILTKKEDVYKA